jgi:starvation-inducible DNA-binding protein
MKSSLWKTQNDLAESVREPAIRLLNEHLTGAIDLTLQAKQAHWNVKGPNFSALHLLFDEMAEDLDELSDELAERAVALGGPAHGTIQVVARDTRLPAYSLEITWGCDHVQALSTALAQFGKSVRSAIAAVDEAGDAGTADLFTQASRTVDKLLWKMEAHQCEA